MRKCIVAWLATASVAACGLPANAAFIDDFEGFANGSVAGQGNWSFSFPPLSSESADVVTSPPAYQGSKSLLITDGSTSFIDVRRNIPATQTETHGAVFSTVVRAGQAAGTGVTGLLVQPYRGYWTGSGFDLSVTPLGEHYVYFAGDTGKVLYTDARNGITTELYNGWQADRWYKLDLVANSVAGNLVVDVALTDLSTHTVLNSLTGLSGGLDASRTHYLNVAYSTDSSRAGAWQVDSVALQIPEPATAGAMLMVGGLLYRRRR